MKMVKMNSNTWIVAFLTVTMFGVFTLDMKFPLVSNGRPTAFSLQQQAVVKDGAAATHFQGDSIRAFSGSPKFHNGIPQRKAKQLGGGGGGKGNERKTKWAVCTTNRPPTQAIYDFVLQEDWAIVIVGDDDMAPFHVDGAHSVFLDAAAQKAMVRDHEDFLNLLPWNHFSRKNVGYLYAILHGAELIWDFDDDSELKESAMPTISAQSFHTVTTDKTECKVVNPLPLMGASTSPMYIWPRGFPIDLIHQDCQHTTKHEGKAEQVAIFQSLIDGSPDVDGVFRSTQAGSVQIHFDDKKDRTLIVPDGTFSPMNSHATLATQPALWSLILPISVNERVSDIWRSYITQRLLWDIGFKVGFTPALVNYKGEPRNAIDDMVAEQDLYRKSSSLINYLHYWKGTATTLPGRFEELMITLYERGYVEEKDVLLTQEWLSAINQAGYEFPPLSDQPAYVPPMMPMELQCPRPIRVFVTGVSGMIGSHVARALVTKPCHKIYGLVRPRSNLDTLIGILDKLTLVTGDITDQPRMMTLLEDIRPDYIYHFAAQAINGISYDLPELTLDTNVIGTMNILEAVRRLGLLKCRILLAGSSTEYGRTADVWDGPIPEDAPLDPVSPYGVSKLTTEKLGNQYWMSFGIQVITARFFIQVGVGGTDSLAIHQFCKQIALAEAGQTEPIVRHGNLETKRDMTDCRDSAPIVVKLAEMGEVGEAYNIGSGNAMSIQHLLDTAISLAKIPMTSVSDASRFRVYDEKVLLSDNQKVRKLTGWVPGTDMHDTVSSILGYWRRRIYSLYDIEEKEISAE